MKKLYSLLVMFVLAAAAFNASAYEITIKIDNPNAIESLVLGSGDEAVVYAPAPQIVISSTIEDYLVVKAKDGFALTSCHVTTERTEYDAFSSAYKDSYNLWMSEGYDGQIFAFTTANLNALRTNTATVTVNGKPEKVNFQFSGTYLYSTLQEGENVLKFMDAESTVYISSKTYGQYLYSITQNGVEVESYYNRWTLVLADGDEIVINTEYPDIDCAVAFTFAQSGMEDYITEVRVNDVAVDNWLEGITAKAGDNLAFRANTQLYRLNEFKVNDEVTSFSGSYSVVLKNDMNFYFDIVPYGKVKANVSVDTPANLRYRIGYSGNYTTASESPFTVEINESEASYTPVYFTATDDAYIVSITTDGNPLSKNYDGTYSTYITEGMNIEVTTAQIVRDSKAYIYVHNPSEATNYNVGVYGYYVKSNFSNSINLSQGYNPITFGDIDNPYEFGMNGNEAYKYGWFYVNGVLTDPTNASNSKWEFQLNNNDVIKVYFGASQPSTYSVDFQVTGVNAMPEVLLDYVVPVELAASRAEGNYAGTVLPGTHVIVKPAGEKIVVKVDGVDVEAEDGEYSFDVNANTSVAISGEKSGVENVAVEAGAIDGAVYNLSGVKVAASAAELSTLPAGVYVVNGSKVLVR